jgi:AraC-like DNA-binding protein
VSAELVAEAFGDSSRSESSFVAVFDMRDSGLLFLETGSALDAEEIPTLETVLSEPDRNGVMTCDIDGEPYSIDHHVAEREELIIVRGVSEGAILSPLRTLQKTSVAILLVVFVVSLGFAFILSRRFSSPLEDVLKTLDGFQARAGTEASGLFDYIRSSVEAMSERNVDLERSLAEQKVSYERLLVFRLLTQGFVNRDDFERRARTAGIIPPSPPYAVVYIDTDTFLERRSTDHELDRLLEVAIVQSLREYGMEWNVALDTSTYLGVFSFSTDSAAFRTVLSEKLSDLGDRWRSEHDVRAVFSVSSVFFDLMDAYDAYLQARTLYERSQLYRDNTVLFYDEQVFQSDRYYYPLELEQRVFYLVQAGEAADLAKLLDELYNENTKPNRNLSRESFQLLATELRGTVYRIRNWLDTNDRLVDEALFSRMREQPENRNRGEQFAEIKRVLVDVANAVGDSKQSHNTQLADRVRVFVEEHYASPDMSLQYMADSIGLSEAYLSRFFKEQMGQNFSAYVTRLRIEKATMYLKSSDMPIKRIASEVGYTRPDAFREAFKRLTGVSPSRFR